MREPYKTFREQARQIWNSGIQAVQPAVCVPIALQKLARSAGYWQQFERILVVGGGKANAALAEATEKYLLEAGVPAEQIKGWQNIPEGGRVPKLSRILLHEARPAGVNFPTEKVVAGTSRILELLSEGIKSNQRTLILSLISGGGSALLAAPVPGVSLEEKVAVSKLISNAGGDIRALNTVRKHLSLIKGGGLVRTAISQPQLQFQTLIISDVVGDPLDVIASGPTVPDPSTFADALQVLDTLDIQDKTPASVLRYLNEGAQGKHSETWKASGKIEKANNHIIANNASCIQAAQQKAEELGFDCINLGELQGDTLEQAALLSNQWAGWKNHISKSARPLCILSGGETTIQLPAIPGKGGRNQSMTLALLENFPSALLERSCILSAGTDGEDGPTDAAGAFADLLVEETAQQHNLKPLHFLQNHDAYPFFKQTGGLFQTGLTETNVMDLRVFLLYP